MIVYRSYGNSSNHHRTCWSLSTKFRKITVFAFYSLILLKPSCNSFIIQLQLVAHGITRTRSLSHLFSFGGFKVDQRRKNEVPFLSRICPMLWFNRWFQSTKESQGIFSFQEHRSASYHLSQDFFGTTLNRTGSSRDSFLQDHFQSRKISKIKKMLQFLMIKNQRTV